MTAPKPLVTTTDFATLTQSIKAAMLVGGVERCETQLDHYNPCCRWVSGFNPTDETG